tara:strand:+ start:33 stop:461 length:429 start_codon:yes stop_codon:yes gene_type:complete
MSLPFELSKYHKCTTKSRWKIRGMKIDSDDFPYVYNEYIHATHCDLCNKEFLTSIDRQLDHDHESGEVRNIVCLKCNNQKEDIVSNTNTGLRYISKCKNHKKYIYIFKIHRDGQCIINKSNVDLDKLIKIRDEFLKNNDIYR